MRLNISVALQYLEAWLGGNGAVAINNLMEDTATAEISRAQLWQWLRHARAAGGRAGADGRAVSALAGAKSWRGWGRVSTWTKRPSCWTSWCSTPSSWSS